MFTFVLKNIKISHSFKLAVSAALKLSRVNEAFPYITSQVTSVLLWHKLFLKTWDKSRHCPRRIGKRIRSSTGCCIVKSLMQWNNLPLQLCAAVMQLTQFSEVNWSSCRKEQEGADILQRRDESKCGQLSVADLRCLRTGSLEQVGEEKCVIWKLSKLCSNST